MKHYTINGTVSLSDTEDINEYDTIIEKLMLIDAKFKGYKVTHCQFDPDSEPYTRYCMFSIETNDSIEKIYEFVERYRSHFIGEIQIT